LKLKKVLRYISVLLVAYIGIHFFLYAFQEKFFFLESSLYDDYKFNFTQDFEEHFFNLENGDRINALYFKTTDSIKGNMLYFHGNSRNLQRWGRVAPAYTKRGYNVLMIDFRGFGKSDGEPTEANLKEDGQLAYDWLKNNYPELPITIYGRSLGSGVAAHIAANNPAQQLILETPFNNLQDVVRTRYPFLFLNHPFRVIFPNDQNLQKVNYPVFIFHGTNDRIIPFECAEKLKDSLKSSDRFYTIEGGRHGNLGIFTQVKTALDEILH
jgi:pimeloyl-ACP methyl ester carboxylesterase